MRFLILDQVSEAKASRRPGRSTTGRSTTGGQRQAEQRLAAARGEAVAPAPNRDTDRRAPDPIGGLPECPCRNGEGAQDHQRHGGLKQLIAP